jgi:hypothetical protein
MNTGSGLNPENQPITKTNPHVFTIGSGSNPENQPIMKTNMGLD